jgi:hypothetical protein
MQSGVNLSGRKLLRASFEIRVAGVVREAVAFQIDADTAGEVPGIDPGGLFSAGGSITWSPSTFARADDGSFITRQPTPWSRRTNNGQTWPPQGGDSVTIDVTVTDPQTGESVTARQFTGKILRTGGGVGKGPVSEIIDLTDRLKQPFKMRPLQYAMPSLDEFGQPPVPIQLAPMLLVNEALAEIRWYVSSEVRSGDVLVATTGQGSFWPITGVLFDGRQWGSQLISQPVWSPWGSAALVPLDRDGDPAPPVLLSEDPAPWVYQQPHEITVDLPGRPDLSLEDPGVGSTVDRSTRLVVDPGVGPGFNIVRSPSGTQIQLWQSGIQLRSVEVGEAESVRVTVRLTQASSSASVSARMWVRRESGEVTTAQAAGLGSSTATRVVCRVEPQRGAFGAIVYRTFPVGSTEAWRDLMHEPEAIIRTSNRDRWSSNLAWRASRRWPGQGETGEVLDLLREASQALCAAIWLDEQGRFRWNDAELSNRQPIAASYQVATSLANLDWADESDRSRSAYEVSYQSPAIAGGARSAFPWATGRLEGGTGQSMHPEDDPIEVWIRPPDDQDWIKPDDNFLTLSPHGTPNWIEAVNRGLRSMITYVIEGEWDESLGWAGTQEFVVDETWKLGLKAAIGGYNDDTRVVFKTPDSDGLNKHRVGDESPIVRCWSVTNWARDTRTETSELGTTGQSYSHDASFWVQTGPDATQLARWMRGRASSVGALPDIEISPDIRLQLQDRVRLQDPDFTGLTLTGIVVGKSLQASNNDGQVELKQTVSLRVQFAEPNNDTYDDVEALHDTYGDAQTAYQDQTYQEVADAPRG